MKILLLQLKRIGDLILTTPALVSLRAAFPQAHLSAAVHSSTASLLETLPALDGGIVFGPGRGWTPWQQVLTGHFDAVFDFTGSDRSAAITALSRARTRVAYDQVKHRRPYTELVPSAVRQFHTVDHHLHLIETLAAAASTEPELRVSSPSPVPPYALFHPGSARPEKLWLVHRWADVIAHVRERYGLRCLLTGSAEERPLLAEVARQSGPEVHNAGGEYDLPRLAALVSGASLVISVDTAMVHLAAAFRRPQITLFGPTNPFHWRPRHPRSMVFSAAHPEAPLTTFEPRLPGAPMERLSTASIIRGTDSLLAPAR